jgi:hypothetical protein
MSAGKIVRIRVNAIQELNEVRSFVAVQDEDMA